MLEAQHKFAGLPPPPPGASLATGVTPPRLCLCPATIDILASKSRSLTQARNWPLDQEIHDEIPASNDSPLKLPR
jgi:hypothetical protein